MSMLSDTSRLELFEIKQKFLREIPHPKLVLKFLRQLEKKGGLTKSPDLDYNQFNLNPDQINQPLDFYLELYITEIMKLKQAISGAPDYLTLRNFLVLLFEKQVLLLKKLASYIDFSENLPDADIKMSSAIDSYAVLKRIRELNLIENEIKDYLCKEIMVEKRVTDVFVEACLRANKIILHV